MISGLFGLSISKNPKKIGLETLHKALKVLKPDVIINLVEDGQPKKYTFVIENFAGNLFRRLEQCQDSVILGKTVFVEAMERGQPLPQDSFIDMNQKL